MAIGVEIDGQERLLAALARLPVEARQAGGRAIRRATELVRRRSLSNAPRSPTQFQKNKLRKTRRDTRKQRKATAFTRAKPGGLERSIEGSVDADGLTGRVYVAANSEAGKYAVRIHDEKGRTWHRRGPGTVAKGRAADAKFIERALNDSNGDIAAIIGDELRKVGL